MIRTKFMKKTASLAMAAVMTTSICNVSAFAEENKDIDNGVYVLMNIPYDDFYKAEISNDVRVDLVTSATLQKTRSSLVTGSFHKNSDGTDISGVTYPVKVENLDELSSYKKVSDTDSVTVITSLRGKVSEITYTGKDSLFENSEYAYYVLGDNETPENYKELTVDESGNLQFSKVMGKESSRVENADMTISGSSRYGDYQLNVDLDTVPFTKSDKIYGVVLKTSDGNGYGLRHLENIWQVGQLAWCTGETTEVHGCPTDSEHYKSMIGKTITGVEYITDKGVYELKTSLEVPEYKYIYAGLSWAEYWENENVFLDGEQIDAKSDELDTKGEADKGAFDVVTRATTNHGLHRGSYQCMATIFDTDGNTYKISHWSEDGKTLYTTEGKAIGYAKGVLTLENGETKTMEHYEVSGIKYVPVKIKASDYESFAKQYSTVENSGTLVGGYGEQNLVAYSVTAEVTGTTNGIKIAEKQADGTFKFSKRSTGKNSGIKNAELKKATDIEVSVTAADKAEAYGCFIRVDLNGNYGDLGANMQAVTWDYYGADSTYKQKLATYGTKFAADNWMHKSMGIQLGLTDSLRCRLPEGHDGTGYWKVTVYALGYEDYSVNVQATAENIVTKKEEKIDTTNLEVAIKNAESLNEKDYTAESWAVMKSELNEAKEELAAPHSQAAVDEAIEHLNAAIKSLVKHNHSYTSKVTKAATCTSTGVRTYTCSCGDSYTETIAKTGHKYSETVVKPTYLEQGYTLYKCSSCGNEYKDNYTAKLVLANVSNFKVTATAYNAIKLGWNAVPDADGYIVWRYDFVKKQWVILNNNVKTNSFLNTHLNSGTKYRYAVRAFKKVDGKTVTSPSFPVADGYTNLPTVSNFKVTATANNAIKLGWNKVAGANGYYIYRYDYTKKQWLLINNNVKTNSFLFTHLNPGTNYKFAVRAYKTVDGKNILSQSFPVVETSTNPANVNFNLTTSSGRVNVNWNKVNGATGYMVFYKTSANGSWNKIAQVNANTTICVKTGLKKGQTYYFMVRAYKTLGKTNFLANYNTKTIKVK